MNKMESLFPVWDQLTQEQKQFLNNSVTKKDVQKSTVLHRGDEDCDGLYIVESGQLRAYIISDEGKELTLYRLFEMDMCLFSASCMLSNIQFEVIIEAEKDTAIWIIPVLAYQKLMNTNNAVANYTNQLMASRFTDVMWLMDQILFKGMDSRLASFLLYESNIEESNELIITHEKIANHIGTAREVVTRMLKYFQGENMVRLSRGSIVITDRKKLSDL
ncbi:MAG TPA: Crp/Fnr family transcriptional regulator [Clostridia bacterium]|jgi:CRP/FNR family transcriptional regulator|nr:MAG: Fumarate and nitrate reduction regulatory protein [Firmicutes bacterium ADurb.Bin146]HOD92933.1 Crp/Fnr family transcriptional regulator [Clostridia bacterium]HQM39295.1 Crp/Fnr family transcriptional regulator [Clostridia bacterium]